MINRIISTLSILWILLAGMPTQPKTLYKQPTREDLRNELKEEVYNWLSRNFILFAYIAVIFLLISFVLFIFWLCGVSATESGIYYNHFGGVI